MGEGPNRNNNVNTTISTPETSQDRTANPNATRGSNTNLDERMQGGPTTAQDRAALQDITEQHQRDEDA